MQSKNGDVELSVTLSTKGLKSDVQKIKEEINNAVGNKGKGIQLIDEKQLSKQVDEATSKVSKSDAAVITLTPKVDEAKLNQVKSLFLKAVGFDEGQGWEVSRDAINNYLSAYLALSDTEMDVHRQWLSDNLSMIQSNENAVRSIQEIQEAVSQINVKDITIDVQQPEAIEVGTIQPDIYIDPNAVEEALGDAIPALKPDVVIPEDAMAQAIDDSSPVLQFNEEDSFEIDGGALQRKLDELALTLNVDVGVDSDEVKEETEQVGQDILNAIRRMHEREQEAANEAIEIEPVQPVDMDWEALRQEYDRVTEEMHQFEHQTEQVNEDVEESTNEAINSEIGNYERFIDYIHAAEERAQELAETIADLQDVGIDPSELEPLQREYDTLIDKIALMRQNIEIGSSAWDEMTPTEQLQERVSRMVERFQELGESIISKASQAMRTFGQNVANAGRNIIKAGFERFVNNFKRLGPAVERSTKGLKLGLKNILAYAIGIRGLFALFGKLRSTVVEGVRNLAQWNNGNNEVNKNISMLMSSLSQMKNALGSAFAPILTVVAPALNQLINLVTQAANAIAQLIAMLTGHSTWMKAKKNAEDYAKSLGGAAKAAGKLAGFDDLDVLGKDGGGGGGGALDPNNMFEEVAIEPWVNEWIEKLKKMWDAADFTDLGSAIGKWLKNALDSIPWDDIKALAAKIGKSIATLINGFVEVDGLGETIGKTLAEVFNTAFTFLYNFVTNLHWDSIGKFIGEALLGFVNTIDASLIGSTLGETLKGIITTAFTALQTFMEGGGFTTLGEKISDVINNFFKRMGEVDPNTMLNAWQMLGQTITMGITGLLNTLITAIETTDWSAVGKALTDMITSIDFKQISMDFTDLITAIRNAVVEFMDSVDWIAVGEAIGGLIAGLDFGSIAMDLADMAWSIVKALAEALFGLVDSINSSHPIVMSLVAIIAAAFAAIQIGLIPATALTALRGVIAAAFGALGSIAITLGSISIMGIGAAILGFNVGVLIGNAIQKALGNEPVEVSWDAIFGDPEALKQGLALWWDDIYAGFLALGEWEAMMVEMGINALKGFWQGICDWQAELKQKWDNFWLGVIEWFANLFGIHSPSTVFADFGGMVIQGFINGINSVLQSLYNLWNDIKTTICNIVRDLWTGVVELWNNMWRDIGTAVSNIWSTVTTWWNNIKEDVGKTVEGLRTAIADKWKAIKEGASTWWGDIKGAIEKKVIELKVAAENKVASMRDEIGKKWEALKDKTEKVFTGIKDKIIKTWENIKNGIKQPINNIIGFIEGMINKIIDGINWFIEKLNSVKMEVVNPFDSSQKYTLGFELEPLSNIEIPRLAQGAVIPPNKQFLAMLGDQKSGTNIEAPLDTIKEAFADVVGNLNVQNTGNAVMQVDGRTFARLMTPYVVSELERRGYNVAIMEA